MWRSRSLRRCAWIRSCWAYLRPNRQKRQHLPPRKSRARRCVRSKRPPSRFAPWWRRQLSVFHSRFLRIRPGQRLLLCGYLRPKCGRRLAGMCHVNSPRRPLSGRSLPGGQRVRRISLCPNRFVKHPLFLRRLFRRRRCERLRTLKLFRRLLNRSRRYRAWSSRLLVRLGAKCRRNSQRRPLYGQLPCRRRLPLQCRRWLLRHSQRQCVALKRLSQ